MLKLVLVGDQKVGKLSLNLRYSLNAEPGSNACDYPLDYYSRNITIGQKDIEIQTWHYNHEVSRYIQQAFIYRKAQGIIICYAIDDRQSFNNVQKWIDQIKQYSREDIELILIGTKCDQEDQRQVSYKEGKQLADQLGILFFETSSQKDINVKEAFNVIINNIINNKDLQKEILNSSHQSLSSKTSTQSQFCYSS
ncbi:small guanosine triphosphatase family (GTPase)-like Ras family protein (macronuclear) [Tetrahymena thermophila SB210]|uniref:Small guanosine triphosphatase family (GTPase)-like Ras family protein n=2 Tax=Tetrahymena thermophila TaxID=5911 RepID=I7M9N4_TETTS|nr:small guanosine triphosphatase family (GTPase)-like Ras family protein [Tetrahymena thermophila SB210]EAS02169.2 small guanosine triphosphatase family (GTPase)-like Ras family protein [Tetrahymena thermophila SB210]BAJ21317.1 Rab-family small GTPase RabX17 [Tetrahymena thermophila]|eukprot:XP_001022414.2 small guanosine triphosphatase family (GTPase)-like Ras family protein [Tetrahymena thermophila SB210]